MRWRTYDPYVEQLDGYEAELDLRCALFAGEIGRTETPINRNLLANQSLSLAPPLV